MSKTCVIDWKEIDSDSELFDSILGKPDSELPFYVCRKSGNDLIAEYTLIFEGRPVELTVDVLESIDKNGSIAGFINYNYYEFRRNSSECTILKFSTTPWETKSGPDGDQGVNCQCVLQRDGKHGIKIIVK